MIIFLKNVPKYFTHLIFRSAETKTRTLEKGACILNIITEHESDQIQRTNTTKVSLLLSDNQMQWSALWESCNENCVFSFARLSVRFHLSRSYTFILFLGLVVLYIVHKMMYRNID